MDGIYTGITLANIALILILLYYFYQTYKEVKSKFALGLVVFAIVLLVNAVFMCPLFQAMFIGEHACPYTPYYTIAGGFEFVALLILIYLVRK
jgi:Gpi18-like mannosyltransferase